MSPVYLADSGGDGNGGLWSIFVAVGGLYPFLAPLHKQTFDGE
jgi:hypothetical protein